MAPSYWRGARKPCLAAAERSNPLHASRGSCEDDDTDLHRGAKKKTRRRHLPESLLGKRTAAKPASTQQFQGNATGWRCAKWVRVSTRSRKLPLRIFSAAPDISRGGIDAASSERTSFSKARAASRMLPAIARWKSAPDRCFSRACSSSSSAVPEATSLAASAAS